MQTPVISDVSRNSCVWNLMSASFYFEKIDIRSSIGLIWCKQGCSSKEWNMCFVSSLLFITF